MTEIFGVFVRGNKLTVVTQDGVGHQAELNNGTDLDQTEVQQLLATRFGSTTLVESSLQLADASTAGQDNDLIIYESLLSFWNNVEDAHAGSRIAFPLPQGMASLWVTSAAGRQSQLTSLKLRIRTASLSKHVLQAQLEADQIFYAVNVCVEHVDQVGTDPSTLVLRPWDGSQLQFHPLLPFPDQPDWEPKRQWKPSSVRSGIIGVVNYSTRKTLQTSDAETCIYQSTSAAMSRVRNWDTERLTTGAANVKNEDAALWASIGEAIERYAGNIPPCDSTVMHGTWSQINQNVRAVHPSSFVNFSEKLPPDPRFGMTNFDEHTRCNWIESTELSNGSPVMVPAAMVYVSSKDLFRDEPRIAYPALQGIAAGTSYEAAVVSGIEEVIERDTTMGWWYNSPNVPAGLRTIEDSDRRETWALDLPNRFGVPVVAVTRHDRQLGLLNVGFAARNDRVYAQEKAFTEALTLEGTQLTYQRQGGIEGIQEQGLFDLPSLRAWRSDRAYLKDYANDFSDVQSLMSHPQIALDPQAQETMIRLLTPDRPDEVNWPSFDRTLNDYQTRIEREGYRIIVTDLTTHDVRKCGWTVVRVTIPGLIPNTPAGFPVLGSDRWRNYARENCGTPKNWDDVNLWPLPHA